jgi:integrase
LKTREGAIAAGANASSNLELANLKRIYTLAMQEGKVLQRPHVPMLKEDNVRKGFFERAQFEGVRARLKPPLAQAVTLAYYTGSEVLTLEWHEVDRKACVIRLEPGTTKNRDGRMFTYGELTEVRKATRKLQALATATGTITGTIGDHRPTGPLIRVQKSRGVSRLAGDRGGDRTRDPRIKSAMLYH